MLRQGVKERKTRETAAREGDYQQLVIQQEITDQSKLLLGLQICVFGSRQILVITY